MSNEITRRDFLKSTSMIAVGLTAPTWLASIARADLMRQSTGRHIDPNTILVVCQFSGGNDGLNTVVPYADAKYHELRPTLGISETDALHIDERMGLHPSLLGLQDLYKQGKVAIIQQVGYPHPNRSHFKSMDIWQSASPEQTLKYGWIGRYMDSKITVGPANPVMTIGLSTEKPLALQAAKASIPCFASLADIQSMVGDPDAERMLRQIQQSDGSTDSKIVQDAGKSALDAMSSLREKLAGYTPNDEYANDKFGQGFKQMAQLIATSPQTRVLYFSTGGFDTHAHQADNQAKLLQGFGDAIKTFMAEMAKIGKDKKVMVLVFSEFGRRSYENASGGTDHGAAGPMFLIGGNVKGGLYGPIPDFDDLQDGDLKFKIDFRQVYATTLDHWMGADSTQVLGQKFDALDVIKGV